MATTSIVGAIVAEIGGERIFLAVLLPPGVDPHVFQPTPRDARQVADADVVFANGAGLEEEFLGDLVASAAPRRVVELSAHLPLRRVGADPHNAGFDAHVWMDPTLVAGWTDQIAAVLAAVDPDHAADYSRRAADLARELHALDAWVRERVAAIPEPRRSLVTDHEAFGYFAHRYGFELLDTVIPGVSTASEPSARHLAAVREAVAARGIPAIFVGVSMNPGLAQSLADDLGIEVVQVYAGSLSEPGGPADTYPAFIRTNVERIVAALGTGGP